MANYFAIKSGNWDDTTVWDSGIIPTSADVVYTNGFTVTINSDLDVNQLRSGSNNGQLPNMIVPVMTSNNTPSGVASASANNTTAFNAFNGIGWFPATSIFTLQYDFPSPVIIKKYRVVSLYNNAPKTWTFQGYNITTSTWDNLDTVTTSINATICYISSILANPTAYSSYRLNVTAIWANPVVIYNFDMTQSSAVTNSGIGGTYLTSALPILPATRTITVRNTTSGIVNVNAVNVFQISATSGIININHATLGNLVGGGSIIANQYNIYATPTAICTININGNLFGDTVSSGGSARNSGAFGIAGSITTNIIGNLTAGNMYKDAGDSTWGSDAVVVLATAGNSTINITGNLLGQQSIIGSPGSDAVFLIGNNATLNVTGNITAGVFSAIRTAPTQTGNINIITGTVTASSTVVGINNLGSGTVTLSSPIINTNNIMGVYSRKINLYSTAQVQWLFQNNAGTNTILYSAGASLGLPLTTNVRYPIQYGASNELTGQLVMPLPSNVRVGVPTDNTIGTGELTAADFLAAIGVSTDPVAERLRTVSTVDTTGNQMASFNV
jgi:hypothetical protein